MQVPTFARPFYNCDLIGSKQREEVLTVTRERHRVLVRDAKVDLERALIMGGSAEMLVATRVVL
jgi:hypothetical protein